eukprot:12427583-Karenia_brevis.AAC.1
MCNAGIKELTAQLLMKQHGWAGHAIRLDGCHAASQWAHSGTLECWRFIQDVCGNIDAQNTCRWRHSARGRK